MKSTKYLFLFAIMFLFSYRISAQDVTLYSGSLDFLKGQTNLNVEFVYDGMKVGEFTEEIYLKQKRTEFRKAPDGEKFVKKWVTDRAAFYEPKFMTEINKVFKRMDLVAAKNTPADTYTMQVKTVKTEPGYYNGTNTNKRNTYVDLQINFYETANPEKILCTLNADKIVGVTEEQMQMIETTTKITNAYAVAAEKISKLVVKICTKKEKAKDDPGELDKTIKKDKKDVKSEDDQEEMVKPDKKEKKDKKSDVEEEEVDKTVKKDSKDKKPADDKKKTDKPVKKETKVKKMKKDPNDED